MVNVSRQSINTSNILSVIMGGGQGTRLFPLTKERAKPAVPLAGKYRLVDVPISNCINSGIRRIYILTQFNSASLHRHISQSYKFDQFSAGFVEILAAQQLLATREGVFCEPASAASLAGAVRHIKDGKIAAAATVVCTLTGHGLKDPDMALRDGLKGVVQVAAERRAVERALKERM